MVVVGRGEGVWGVGGESSTSEGTSLRHKRYRIFFLKLHL